MLLLIDKFIFEVRHRFLLRWVLANVVGWTIGLYMGVLNPLCFAGTGIITGLVLGATQWWALQDTLLATHPDETSRIASFEISRPAQRWIGFTFAGAALGLIPAAILGAVVYLFANGLAALLAGGLLGLAVGIGQWMVLKRLSQQVFLWLLINVVGGAICGLLTVIPIIRGLPLGLLAGSALFGYLSGRVLERIMTESLQ